MTIKAFRKPGQGTLEGTALAQAVEDFTRQLVLNPVLGGNRIKQIAVTAGNNDIPHSLTSRWQGWIITRNNSNITLYETTPQTNDKIYLSLTSTGTGTIDVYVF